MQAHIVAALPLLHAHLKPRPDLEHVVATFLVEISVLLITAKVLGAITNRLGLGELTGELITGLLWGPTVIATNWPSFYHDVFPLSDASSDALLLKFCTVLGVIILIFLSGMEIDLADDATVQRGVVYVTAAGLITPLAAGLLFAHFVPASFVPKHQFWGMAVLLAIGLSATTIPILARVIADNGVGKTRFGQVLLASALGADTVGWALLVVTLTVVVGNDHSAGTAVVSIFKSLAAITVIVLGPRYLSPLLESRLRRFWISSERLFALSAAGFLVMCAAASLWKLNIYLGAIIYAVILARIPLLRDAMIRGLSGFASALFVPLFFISIGLSANLTNVLKSSSAIVLSVALLVVATLVKVVPCYVAAKLAGLTEWEARTVAIGMNARGGMELVIAAAALAAGVWSNKLFTVVVVLALVTNIAASPTVNLGLRRMGREQGALAPVTGGAAAMT